MTVFDLLAERKIAEAVSNGELDDLPGAGRPLELDDDALVPEELRLAYRILKNAGYAPPEIEALARSKAERKLSLLGLRIESPYCRKALRKLAR